MRASSSSCFCRARRITSSSRACSSTVILAASLLRRASMARCLASRAMALRFIRRLSSAIFSSEAMRSSSSARGARSGRGHEAPMKPTPMLVLRVGDCARGGGGACWVP